MYHLELRGAEERCGLLRIIVNLMDDDDDDDGLIKFVWSMSDVALRVKNRPLKMSTEHWQRSSVLR